jgi:creatinine amidohydrolase
MHWEELTGDQFPLAVQEAGGVCLLPLSCLERHGHHLPLSTDKLIAGEVCRRAAELEPAVVFPDFIFTQILEARHTPGCLAIEPDLILRLLDNVCREIARNGLKKVLIVNGHGGNDYLIHFFAQAQLASPRDYVVYVAQPPYQLPEAEAGPVWETQVDGHAGERETSAILALRPELVKRESLPADGEGQPLGRLKPLRDLGVDTGIWWYADHPSHYCGDGRPATAEKGEFWFETTARSLARTIRAVKQDEQSPLLQAEFFKKSQQH